MGKTLEGVWIYTSALRRSLGARAAVKTARQPRTRERVPNGQNRRFPPAGKKLRA